MEMGILSAIKRAFKPKELVDSCSERLSIAQNLIEWGSYDEAIDILQSTILQNPHNYLLHYHLGEAYRLSGQKYLAIEVYQTSLKIEPSDPLGISIRLSNWGCIKQPTTLPITYIQNLFDQYALSFEKCLIENLDYKAPEVVYKVTQSALPNHSFDRILDLGCGTGLSSIPFFKGQEWIEGVDISKNMLNEADKKKVFQKLHHISVSEFLANSNEQFDLILSIDLFIYLGKMENYFSLIKRQLKKDGIFAFTIQNSQTEGFVLGEDGRYSHHPEYVLGCAKSTGLNFFQKESFVLRKEHGKEVRGTVFLLKIY